jgi:hypothetical protein
VQALAKPPPRLVQPKAFSNARNSREYLQYLGFDRCPAAARARYHFLARLALDGALAVTEYNGVLAAIALNMQKPAH